MKRFGGQEVRGKTGVVRQTKGKRQPSNHLSPPDAPLVYDASNSLVSRVLLLDGLWSLYEIFVRGQRKLIINRKPYE